MASSALLPAPSPSFPQPTAGFPTMAPAPYLGLTSTERATFPTLGTPTQFGATDPNGLLAGNTQALTYLQTLTGGAVGPSNDPHTWTPQEAAGQTDRALARIAQVNPEMAQMLAQQHGQEVQPTDGGGFLNGLKHVAATILGAPGIKQAFDIISRPGHIIATELVHPENGLWQNASDALMGRSTDGFGQVLDKYGLLQGDDLMSRVAHGAAAFVGDVASDPMTYLLAGAGGIAKEAIGKTVTEATIKAGLAQGTTEDIATLIARIGAKGAGGEAGVSTIDDLATAIWQARIEGGGLVKSGLAPLDAAIDGMKRLHPDTIGGVLKSTVNSSEKVLLENALRMGDEAWKVATTSGWSRFTAKQAAELGLPKAAVDEELRRLIGAGRGLLPGAEGKALYEQGKIAGAALGGVRFRMSVPILGVRWQTGKLLPFTEHLNFQIGRRFFSGQAGQLRLMKGLEKGSLEGVPITTEHIAEWYNGGYSKLRKFDAKAADALAGGSFLHGGSPLYPASQAFGDFTARLSPHAKMLRGGGLGEYMAAQAAKRAPGWREDVSDSILTVVDTEGKVLTPQDVETEIVKGFGLTGGKTSAEQLDKIHGLSEQYGYLMPTAQAMKDGAEKHFDGLRAEAVARGKLSPGSADYLGPAALADDLAGLDRERASALELERQIEEIGPDARRVMGHVRTIKDQYNRALQQAGHPGASSVNDRLAAATELLPDQAKVAASRGHALTQDIVVTSPDLRGVDPTALGEAAYKAGTHEDDAFGFQYDFSRTHDQPRPADLGEAPSPFGTDPSHLDDVPPVGPTAVEADARATVRDTIEKMKTQEQYTSVVSKYKTREEILASKDADLYPTWRALNEPDKLEEVMMAERGFLPPGKAAANAAEPAVKDMPQEIPLKVEQTGRNLRIQTDDGQSFVMLEDLGNGDFSIVSTMVEKSSRRGGIATAMYERAAKYADERGGRVLSDQAGARTPDAEKLWKGLQSKGLDVTEEDGRYVLKHTKSDVRKQAELAVTEPTAAEKAARVQKLLKGQDWAKQDRNAQAARTQEVSVDALSDLAIEDYLVQPGELPNVNNVGEYVAGAKIGQARPVYEGSPIVGWTKEKFEEMKAAIETGDYPDSWMSNFQHVYYDARTGKASLADGNHRLALFKYLGKTHMPVYVHQVNPHSVDKGLVAGIDDAARVMQEHGARVAEAKTLRDRAVAMDAVAKTAGLPADQLAKARDAATEAERQLNDLTGGTSAFYNGKPMNDRALENQVAQKAGLFVENGKVQNLAQMLSKEAKPIKGAVAPEAIQGAKVSGKTVILPAELKPGHIFPRDAVRDHGRVDEFVVYPQNPVHLDLRTDVTKGRFLGGAAGQMDNPVAASREKAVAFVDQLEARIKESGTSVKKGSDGKLEELVPGFDALSPEVQDMLLSELVDRDGKISELMTADLRGQGYDAIHVTDDAGEHGTIFPPEGKNPLAVARINPNAPRVLERHGTSSFVLTSDVQEAVAGTLGTNQSALTWVQDLARQAQGMEPKAAEDMVLKELNKAGIELRAGQRVFETDPLKISVRLADRASRLIVDQHLGKIARRIDRNGFARSPYRSAAVGLDRYKWVMGEGGAGLLDKQTADVRMSAERYAKLSVTLGHDQEATRQLEQKLAALNERVAGEGVATTTATTAAERTAAEEALRVAQSRMEKSTMLAQDAMAEQERMLTKLKTGAAQTRPALIPVEGAGTMTGFTKLDIPGLQKFALPSFMAEELNFASRGFHSLDGFHAKYREFMSWWKSWATYRFPGFHARNMMGGWFNNFLGGVQVRHYVIGSRVAAAAHEINTEAESAWKWANRAIGSKDAEFFRVSGLAKYWMGVKTDMTYGDLANIMSRDGIRASHGRSFAEARVGTEYLESKLGQQKGIERIPFVGRPYEAAMKGAGTMTENLLRSAAYVKGLETSGGSFEFARAFTMLRHGDYQDLTDLEYGTIRDLIPFYKWMRTNTPFQIHQLFESPGKLLALYKAQDAAWGVMGHDYDKEKYKLPSWMLDSITVPTSAGKDGALNVMMLDLPTSDLFMGGRDFISSFLPMVRPFLESYITKQSTFTGAPITGKPVKMGAVFAPLFPILNAVGITHKGADGGTYTDDKTQNILGIIPVFSRMRNWLYEDPDKVKLRSNTFMSAVLGLGLRPVDQQAMASNELEFYYSQILPAMAYVKGLGYQLPTTNDITALLGTTDQALAGVGISSAASRYTT